MHSDWFKETASSENMESKETIGDENGKTLKEISTEKKETSSAEISMKAYDETVRGITTEFEDIIPYNQRVRIGIESKLYKPTVMTPEAYHECYPKADPNVLGHYDSNGRIYIKEGSPETLTHVVTHEAMHLTSFNEVDDTGGGLRTYRSGIRETICDETGLREDHNRALNEGITELYAIREMQRRGEVPSVEAVSAYPEAQKAAFELQDIVGCSRIQEAYFGGDTEQLKNEVIRLSYGDETAWARYTENVDTLEYSKDQEKIQAARWKLTEQNAIMLSFKEDEAGAAQENRQA